MQHLHGAKANIAVAKKDIHAIVKRARATLLPGDIQFRHRLPLLHLQVEAIAAIIARITIDSSYQKRVNLTRFAKICKVPPRIRVV